MKTIDGHIQVYSIWVNGRLIDDTDQHFPLESNVENCRNWTTNFKKVVKDYFKISVKDMDGEYGPHSDIYKDYHVALYAIDINVRKFEKMFQTKFDIKDDKVQELIPYYVNYNFITVAERLEKFINYESIRKSMEIA
jgi:hypothetical protein